MAHAAAAATTGNALLMVAVVPLPAPLHALLSSVVANTVPHQLVAPQTGKEAAPPAVETNQLATANVVDQNTTKPSPPVGEKTTPRLWQWIHYLRGSLTEDDRQAARNLFKIDASGRLALTLPDWTWPDLPWYATRDGVSEVLSGVRQSLPTLVGAAACSTAIAYRQPGLCLRYATDRLHNGAAPWLGGRLARLSSVPATAALAVAGLPLLLTAIPAYYSYLVVSEAGRIASELGNDAHQLHTVMQIIAERCEPVFRAADDLPPDAAFRVIALGLKQHLPGHVVSVVEQTIYVGRYTHSISDRLVSVLEAASTWAQGENGRAMLDQLVRMTEQDIAYQVENAPCAA